MARKLSTLNKGRTGPVTKVNTPQNSEFDWSKVTGKFGTHKIGIQFASSKQQGLKMQRSLQGPGGPYVIAHFDPDSDLIAELQAGITLEAANMEVRVTKNGKVNLDATLYADDDTTTPIRITIGGWVTEENATLFQSVTIQATGNVPAA